MDRLLAHVRSEQKQIVTFIQQLVECESPSDSEAALNSFAELFSASVSDIASVRRVGLHLQCDFDLPGARKSGQILALGHSDTVYPLGTLDAMPFRQNRGRLWGPGVLDMKGGIAFFVFAMRALRQLDVPVRRKVRLQLVADEETGSHSSRALTEKEARRSTAVLVLEPGTGLEGKAKTARKGIGGYRLEVHGRAAHAGVDFASGASAIVELARQIERISTFTDLERGITLNPGVISGGTRSNVIADYARADIDFRIAKQKDAAFVERKLLSLRPVDKRCSLQVTGGLNRPPLERTPAIAALFRQAQSIAQTLNINLDESSTGGGSDGNFTAAVGTPTLDGIGAVGEGAHSPGESILINRIADRTALLAHLVASL